MGRARPSLACVDEPNRRRQRPWPTRWAWRWAHLQSIQLGGANISRIPAGRADYDADPQDYRSKVDLILSGRSSGVDHFGGIIQLEGQPPSNSLVRLYEIGCLVRG